MEVLELIFKLVGGLVVVLLATLVIGFYLLKFWLKRKLGAAGMAAMKYAGNSTPARITLFRSSEEWHHGDEAAKLKGAIETIGFVPVDKYEVEEMPDVQLSAFYHPGQSASAVVYDHPIAGCWFDLVTKYPDDTGATVSTAKTPTLIEIPGDLTIKNPAFGVREAWDTLLAQRKPGPFVAIDSDNFVAVFEASYARFMDHVLAKGEINEKFVRDSGKSLGMNASYSDQQYAEAKRIEEEKMRGQISDACLDNFVKASKLTAAQWEACRERTLVVHERMTAEEVIDTFMSWTPDLIVRSDGSKTEGAKEDPRVATAKAETSNPVELFEKLNALLPARRAYLKLGEVTLPAKALVMLAPR